jgi:magnesium-transporting ATPase (P-type)
MGVACSNSDSILIAARVNVAFFDKTGTLTKQGLDYVSSRSAESWNSGQWSSDTISMSMMVCHSLISAKNGELIGNPVDRAMFASTNARLLHVAGTTATIESIDGSKYEILRRFEFDHNRMTQSVVVQLPGGVVRVVVKGSGEQIRPLCGPDTVPNDYLNRLQAYSRRGIYQLAVATKDVKLSLQQVGTLTRDEAECDLVFAGVLNFANQMREDTPEVIKQLSEADVQSIMLTGDNLFTGVHIARQASIIMNQKAVLFGTLDEGGRVIWKDEDDIEREEPTIVGKSTTELTVELAMAGEAWQMLLSQNRPYAISLAPFIRVFGRCSPQDKVSVVDTFTDLGLTTMMCGDGGNDCGALKAAHIGLALSDGDASLVAPFTSLRKDIADVLTVLKEGRAAMTSTMAAYKMIILYGNVSSYCQWITLSLDAAFSEWMWIFVDVCWTVPFALALPLARHAATLSKARPTSSLLSLQTVGSIVGIIILNYIFMAIALVVLNNEAWFQCRKIDIDGLTPGSLLLLSDNYYSSVVFLMVGTQLISAAISFNFGHEYRRAWYRNLTFVILAIGYSVLHIYITLIPGSVSCLFRINCDNDHIVRGLSTSELIPIGNPFNSTIMPMEFRVKLLGIMLSNGLAVGVYEYFVVNGLWQRRRFKKTLAQPAIRNAEP